MRYIVVAILVGAALVGCGSSKGNESASNTSPTSDAATPSAASQAVAQIAARIACTNPVGVDAKTALLILGAKTTSTGKCSVGSHTINIAVYGSANDRKRADAVVPTAGCALMKTLGVTDTWTVERDNWITTTTSESTARAIAPKAGVKAVHVHCP